MKPPISRISFNDGTMVFRDDDSKLIQPLDLAMEYNRLTAENNSLAMENLGLAAKLITSQNQLKQIITSQNQLKQTQAALRGLANYISRHAGNPLTEAQLLEEAGKWY